MRRCEIDPHTHCFMCHQLVCHTIFTQKLTKEICRIIRLK